MSIGIYWFEGGVVADPELGYSNNNTPYCRFRLAQSDSRKGETGEWETLREAFWQVTMWGKWAEKAKEALTKGSQIVVKAKPVTNAWENKEGEKRSRIELVGYEFYMKPSFSQGDSAPPVGGDVWGDSPARDGFAGNDDPPF